MIGFQSELCRWCKHEKVVLIHNEVFGTRMQSIYAVVPLAADERYEVACGFCGTLYSDVSLPVYLTVFRRD